MNSRKMALIAVLASLAIATNYLMVSLYNVKFMDMIVFVGGFCFGPVAGALIGSLTWAVYGTLNPIGFSLPVWIATMSSETIYGVMGGMMRKVLSGQDRSLEGSRFNLCIFFGILGAFLTVAYDMITNIAWGYVSGLNVLIAVLSGIPFGLVHEASNAVFFGVGCVPAINALFKVIGVETVGFSKK